MGGEYLLIFMSIGDGGLPEQLWCREPPREEVRYVAFGLLCLGKVNVCDFCMCMRASIIIPYTI
ncbi:MAG: hypothetical protein ACLRMZ_20230 [Blautia marasmi]